MRPSRTACVLPVPAALAAASIVSPLTLPSCGELMRRWHGRHAPVRTLDTARRWASSQHGTKLPSCLACGQLRDDTCTYTNKAQLPLLQFFPRAFTRTSSLCVLMHMHAFTHATFCCAGGNAAEAALLRPIGQALSGGAPGAAACSTASWGSPNALDACGANFGSAWAGIECSAVGSFRKVVGVNISGCIGLHTSDLVPLTALAALTRLGVYDSALQVGERAPVPRRSGIAPSLHTMIGGYGVLVCMGCVCMQLREKCRRSRRCCGGRGRVGCGRRTRCRLLWVAGALRILARL